MINCKFENGHDALLRHVSVDTIVTKDGNILMVKRTGKLLEGGKWCLPGGFVERDETLKKAVAREVMEETGWTIDNIELLTIRDNPDRPKEDRQNIAFVYMCNAVSQKGVPDNESDDQKWFSLDSVPQKDNVAFDHYSDVQLFKKWLTNPATNYLKLR